ncbi:glycosyltransferase family 2 protein [Nocardiopsis sp. YSL2]|uniref:glycosyltransferase n=1 Tax=Nocardiopsis sp. YSL2 TaxID=2939492 RepID=UPI0026F47A3D|nr:glycosyltransferase family A protein [Nocardiopsis sp. YSL2]
MSTADEAARRAQESRRGADTVGVRTTPPAVLDFAEQPRLVRNDRAKLDPPALGHWEPRLSVSVVVPVGARDDTLAPVLAALAGQSYPAELTEVVVVAERAEPPAGLPSVRPEHTRLVTPGEGASAHPVNAGVAASTGQVVLCLRPDVLVDREHVESQMRWHHLVDYAVVVAGTRPVEAGAELPSPDRVLRSVLEGTTRTLFADAGREREGAEAPERTGPGAPPVCAGTAASRVFTGESGSLHRTMFDEVAGMDRDAASGGDAEFAYRVAQRGAVFVEDADAGAWRLGQPAGPASGAADAPAARLREAYVAARVPDSRERRRRPGPLRELPLADVVLETEGATQEEVETSACALLNGTTPDIRLWLRGSWSAADTEAGRANAPDPLLLEDLFRNDPRVRLTEDPPEDDPRVPFRLYLPAGPVPVAGAVEELLAAADGAGAGLLRALLRGAAREGELRLERTAAFARARRLEPKATGRDLDRVVEEVHGVHWTTSTAFVGRPADESGEQESLTELRERMERAERRVRQFKARAQRAERKLRWFTPGLAQRILRRLVR